MWKFGRWRKRPCCGRLQPHRLPVGAVQDDAAVDGLPLQALPYAILLLLAEAEKGDLPAIAHLYRWSAAWLKAGRAPPEPVASFMARRLDAIGRALLSPDARAALPGAVAPHPKNNRTQGARANKIDMLAEAAQFVIDLLEVDSSRGRRVALVATAAAQTGFSPSSIDRKISALRAAKRT